VPQPSKSSKWLAVRSLVVFRDNGSCDAFNRKDGLANLEVMLHVVGSFGDHLPPACEGTYQEVWPVFDAFLAKYGSDYESAEHVTRVLRHALNLFGRAVSTIAADVLGRMSVSFASSGLSCYLWIAGKVLSRFDYDEDAILQYAVRDIYGRSTQKILAMLQEKSATTLPDGGTSFFSFLPVRAD
jgi:transportin-3